MEKTKMNKIVYHLELKPKNNPIIRINFDAERFNNFLADMLKVKVETEEMIRIDEEIQRIKAEVRVQAKLERIRRTQRVRSYYYALKIKERLKTCERYDWPCDVCVESDNCSNSKVERVAGKMSQQEAERHGLVCPDEDPTTCDACDNWGCRMNTSPDKEHDKHV